MPANKFEPLFPKNGVAGRPVALRRWRASYGRGSRRLSPCEKIERYDWRLYILYTECFIWGFIALNREPVSLDGRASDLEKSRQGGDSTQSRLVIKQPPTLETLKYSMYK